MLSRRAANAAVLLAALGLPLARARAQSGFPNRPLRIVVPNAAGGAADLTARAVAEKLGAALGQPVVVENKPSAGGIVAGEGVVRSEPDGHTLLLISSGTAVSAGLFKALPFDTLRDFAPVSLLAQFDLVLAVAEGGRFQALADLLAYARANPGRLNIGTPQIGTTQHLAAELLRVSSGLDFQVVPFNGTPPVIHALRGGQIDAMVDILGPLLPQIQSRALRAVGIMGERRASQLPEVPALREAGGTLAGFGVSSWNGLAVPARTPRELQQRLSRDIQAALQQPDVRKRLSELGLTAQGSSPEAASEHLAADMRRWADVIQRAKIARQ